MKQISLSERIVRDFKQHKYKYLLVLPVIIYFIIFSYKPMYGALIAFQNYRPALGVSGSEWAGFDNFTMFFNDIYFGRIMRNTVSISLLSIIFGFPAPILLALMINQIRNRKFKRTVQTITYMPYFISAVAVCGLIKTFCQSDGLFNNLIVLFGGERSNLLSNKELFYPIYIISSICQSVGWDSIIYLSALSSIDQAQYEAADIDGAGRFRKMISITLPSILPTIVILLILRMGSIMNVSYEKILLLYQPSTYEVADVISTYVFRKGILEANYSYSTAVGLFNSAINICFLVITNKISKKVTSDQISLY